MKKISVKIIISVLLVMLVACSAVAALSFALADEENGTPSTGGNVTVSANKKIIDYIIDYSYKSSDYEPTDTTGMSDSEKLLASATDFLLDESVYHIVEIGSSSKMSDLAKLAGIDPGLNMEVAQPITTYANLLAANGTFKNLVIDGHRSYYEGKTDPMSFMNDRKVSYTYIDNTKIHSDLEIFYAVKAVNKADLVYVSMDNTSMNKLYNSGNDLCEELKIALSAYATGDFKPLIIDSYTKTLETIGSEKNMGALAADIFEKSGSSYSTYSWPAGHDVATFMSRTNAQDFYLPLRGDQFSQKWTEIFKTVMVPSAADPNVMEETLETTGLYMAKVLVITSGSTSSIGAKFTAGLENATAYVNPDVKNVDLTNAYEVPTDSTIYKKAYYSRWTHPDIMKFDTLDVSNEDELAKLVGTDTFSLEDYDFILIDANTQSVRLSNEEYASLQGAMMAGTGILYDTGVIGKGTSGSTAVCDASNFNYVYDKVATATDMPRTSNILVTTRGKMAAYAMGIAPVAVDDIANIINGGTFRGISGGGSGDSSTIYTVLEIEPSYPIDEQLAAAFNSGNLGNIADPNTKRVYAGNTIVNAKNFYAVTKANLAGGKTDPGMYYIRTGDVLDATADEISYDGTTALSVMKNNNYAALTNAFFTENAANISDYYAWKLSKAKIAHATGKGYDEVNVVHMSSKEFNASKASLLDTYDAIYVGGDYSSMMSARYWTSYALNGNTGIYMMYRHDGDLFKYSNGYYNAQEPYGVFLGNDISSDRLTELTSYMEAGMPIIVDANVAAAYADITNANQILIDPQSNMANFLKRANGRAGANVLWGFDSSKTVLIANPNNMYGNTVGGVVTVFGGVEAADYLDNEVELDGDEKRLSDLLRSKERPKLYVTKTPMKFTEGDPSTWLTTNKLDFEFEVNSNISKDAKVNLYIDDNSDSKFDEISEKSQTVNASTGKVSVTVPDTYFGVVYWKLEVVDGNVAASTTGVCKIARTTQEKMKINLVQLMPELRADDKSEATLYLCKECQQSRIILYGNRSVPGGQYKNSKDQILSLEARAYDYSKPADIDGNTLNTNYASDILKAVDTTYKYSDIYANYFGTTGTGLNSGRGGYSTIGVHDHSFGIVKYYENGTIFNNTQFVGVDEWNTNWFDELKEDYDVDLTILTIGQFNKMVENINSAYSAVDTTEDDKAIENLQLEYQEEATKYQQCYDALRAIINQDVQLMMYDGSKSIYGKVNLAYNGTANTVTATVTVDSNQAGYSINKAKADAMASSKEAEINANLQTLFTELSSYIETVTNRDTYRAYYGVSAQDIAGLDNKQVAGVIAYAMLDKFLHSSETIDKYLLDNYDALSNADLMNNAPKSYISKELDIYTDPAIDRDKRQYYDFFSLAGKGSNNIKITINGQQHYPFEDMAKLYVDYRDAKTFEMYFKEMAFVKGLYASVNLEADKAAASMATMSNMSVSPLNKIDLSNVIDCIAIGAAQNFGTSQSYNTEKDITPAGCNALLDYIYDGGDMILFHSSLTAEKGLTDTMTAMLSDDFGQNARHMEVDTSGQTTMQFDNLLTFNLGTQTETFTMTPQMLGARLSAKEKATQKTAAPQVSFTYGAGQVYTLPNTANNTEAGWNFTITASETTGSGLTISTKEFNDYYDDDTFLRQEPYSSGTRYIIYINPDDHFGGSTGNWNTATIPQVNLTSNDSVVLNDSYVGSDGKITLRICSSQGYYNPIQTVQLEATATSVTYETHNMRKRRSDWGGGTEQRDGYKRELTSNNKSYVVDAKRTPGVIAEMGTQTYEIVFTNGTAPIANERVTYNVDGVEGNAVSDANGRVVFYRKNYDVTGYDITVESLGENTTGADIDQTVEVLVADMSGEPANGNNVSLTIKPGTDAAVTYDLTTVNGVARKTTPNWKVRPTNTRTFVLKSAYATDINEKYGTKKYYMNAANAGNNAINPQVLSVSAVALTHNKAEYALPYKYTSYDNQIASTHTNLLHGGNDVRNYLYSANGDYAQTDRATKVNDGIVTTYPFTIGDRLQISPTEQNDFAVDIEDPDVTMYYTLAGGSVGTSSSLYAADPHDGAENYFIYQKNTRGTITYIGAGHCCITGLGRNNNDERRLFINIILNSGRLSTKKLSMNLYDHESKIDSTTSVLTNKKVQINDIDESGDDYIYKINDITDPLEFAFLPSGDSTSRIIDVQIYFDVDYDPATDRGQHTFMGSKGDVLIYNKNSADTNALNYIGPNDAGTGYWLHAVDDSDEQIRTIVLQENYFVGTGELQQRYAYVVVKVTDSNGSTVTKVIRIQFQPELHHET